MQPEISYSVYIKKYMASIPGFMAVSDAKIFAALLEAQAKHRFAGSVAEIGVHHGRSFVLLALARHSGERALAIDLFEDDELNLGAHSGRGAGFQKTCRRFGLHDIEVYKGSSLNLDVQTILSRAGRVRFFSIDGGHLMEHVQHDLTVAQESITQEGIIAIDDFCNRLWPEVTFAAMEFLRRHHDIVPFLVSDAQLYCTARGFEQLYRDHITLCFPKEIKGTTSILGTQTILFRRPLRERFRAISSAFFQCGWPDGPAPRQRQECGRATRH